MALNQTERTRTCIQFAVDEFQSIDEPMKKKWEIQWQNIEMRLKGRQVEFHRNCPSTTFKL